LPPNETQFVYNNHTGINTLWLYQALGWPCRNCWIWRNLKILRCLLIRRGVEGKGLCLNIGEWWYRLNLGILFVLWVIVFAWIFWGLVLGDFFGFEFYLLNAFFDLLVLSWNLLWNLCC
jgi:hypothetical protein